jgi:hypothetical protein
MAVTKVATDGTRKVLKKKPIEGVVIKKATISRKKATPVKEEAPPKVEAVEAPIIVPPPIPYTEKWAGLLENKRMERKMVGRWDRFLNYTIGFDPEVFVRDGTRAFVPAWDGRLAIPVQNKSNTMYRDGFAVEFKAGTVTPNIAMYCHEYGVTSIYRGLENLRWHIAGRGDFIPVLEDFVEVPPEILQSASPEDVRLGCSPSLNAYGDNPVLPDDGRVLPFRTAGFHYHLGVVTGGGIPYKTLFDSQEEHDEIMNHCVKMMDFGHVMVTALMGDKEDPRRRRIYGRAGEYRLPPYGVEYRVFSNVIMRDPRWVFLGLDMTRWFFKNYMCGGIKDRDFYPMPSNVPWDEVRGIINESNQVGALEWIKHPAWNSFYNTAVSYTYYNNRTAASLVEWMRTNLKPKSHADWHGWSANGIVSSSMRIADMGYHQ